MAKYAKINRTDVANGPGIRHSIFLSGCEFACEGCFNHELWDFKHGEVLDWKTIWDFIAPAITNKNISGISILGGEPLHPKNLQWTISICSTFRMCEDSFRKEIMSYKKQKTIWLWTGFTLEEMLDDEEKLKILNYIDVLVDGRYIEELNDPNLKYKGSSNQRLLDVRKLRRWSRYINPMLFKFIIRNNIKRFIIPDDKIDEYQ